MKTENYYLDHYTSFTCSLWLVRLAILAFLIPVISGTTLAQTASYYVATTGLDTNPGTLTAPWLTIQHAANVAIPGSAVYVRAGVYNQAVTINVSGSATAGYTTFQSYPGEVAVVDGTGIIPPAGRSGLFFISGRNYLIIKGFEIRNYVTSTNAYPAGVFILGSADHIQILNNLVHDIKTTGGTCNTSNSHGVAAYGTVGSVAISNLTISGNELRNLVLGCSESMVVNGNVQYFTITNNLIHDNNNIGIDVIGFEGKSPDPTTDQARDGLVSGNTIYNITSNGNPVYKGNCTCADGVYIDGGTRTTVERNRIHNVDIGIEVASEHSGKTVSYDTVRNNLIYFGNSAGISVGGYSSKVGAADHITFVNNTLLHNDSGTTGSGEFQIQYYVTNTVFENNIIYANPSRLLIHDYTTSSPDPGVLDYNLYYIAAGAANSTWNWQRTSITGWTNYLTASGKDTHSYFADPQFVSLITPDLHVSSTSPAVGHGIDLGSAVVGTVDFAGNPRVVGVIDIGAYEQ